MDLSPDEDNFPGRLLHQAALWDNLELLQELIANGTPVDARDAKERTALHAAALGERSRCLKALCDAGADVNARQDDRSGGKTALHIAAERGHLENLKTLIAAGASLGAVDAGGDDALALAEGGSHRHAAHLLREARDALERERLSQHAQLRELVARGDLQQLRTNLAALGSEAGLIVNLAPGGANTLLYVASEGGQTAAVRALLAAGADGRAHPVTRYSPLYIACYHGHLDIARTLLAHFPHAVQQETVEKWLPIHAACIGGHAALVTLLLEYPYPESMLNTYVEAGGAWRYRAAFDANAADAGGQSALYVACTLGNAPVVDALLAHRVLAERARPEPEEEAAVAPAQVLSPTRAGISLGIHAIVSKLTGQSNAKDERAERCERRRAVRVSGAGRAEPLAAAVRGAHVGVARRLLAAGAPPDVPVPLDHQMQSETAREGRARSRSLAAARAPSASPSPCRDYNDSAGPWTPLALAARARHSQLAELLLAHGATDADGRALRECARHALRPLVAALLAAKAYPDPDYKVNRPGVAAAVFGRSASGAPADGAPALTYNALCPGTPVMINWRELHCHFSTIRMQWVSGAALRVNPRLGSERAALHAVTRLDLSGNELRLLPPQLFTMISLRHLNVAQNKLERLPSASEPLEEEDEPGSRGKQKAGKGKKTGKEKHEVYCAPVLEELYLQDNRLEEVPPELFSLPALVTLDVSNNKLRALPAAMWAAPRLRDLNAALNHLHELPTGEDHEGTTSSQGQSPCEPPPHLNSAVAAAQLPYNHMKSESRSPSIERSMSEGVDEEDECGVPVLGNRTGNAVWAAARRAHPWRHVAEARAGAAAGGAPLAALNLAHNRFTCVPPALACRAPALARLNMAYNALRSMSYVTSYPNSLRQLDLSHNEITCWPSLPQVENLGSGEGDPLACYCGAEGAGAGEARARPRSGGSVRSQLLGAACAARRHLRLEGLRTLILANNLLTRIQLTTDDDGEVTSASDAAPADDDEDWTTGSSLKGRLLFPLLSMLDVSSNLLRCVPPAIHEMGNLSVLNISGNKDITELPPQMGLLSRLWNLNTSGCPLQEPLRGMLACGKYKSMDIVGYLKSVLQEAQPYARMKLMIVGLQGIGKTSLLECLRQESTLVHRRKPTEHWAKRMGNKTARKGCNMSTVGVDISTWVYEKHRSSKGPVTFRTWDFGGQQEYYATHQYFLSRRSLYLVVWKVTDGRRGLAGALQWLRSIQARAPSSPVIMVATHYDQVEKSQLPENESPEVLQRLIRSSIMGAPDADKLGLPRVLDSVEISCSTRHNIRLLADIIYSVAFSVKPPGSKEPLLEQRVPATYLNLEECVTHLAAELREPVLRHDEYKRLVTQYMQQKNLRMFRDAVELHQATMFLHENGVLLHYDDATLKELYFLRPQWLCDILAHVVTVREINPFASNGIMKVEDLAHVFKASPLLARGDEASSLAMSLLNKFELALCWDVRALLVPPLLPRLEPPIAQLPLRSRSWGARGTPRRAWPPAPPAPHHHHHSAHGTDSPRLVDEPSNTVLVSARSCAKALRRFLLLSYAPCGFWPRLCTRMLADDALADCGPLVYKLPAEMEVDEATAKALDLAWSWKLWKTGLKLVCGELTLLTVREVPARCCDVLGSAPDDEELDPFYSRLRLRVRQDGAWCDLDVSSSACVEISLPAQVCVVKREDGLPIAGYQSISLEPSPEVLAKLLALLSDHVDLLLEDWYPSLGTRFVHTSEGRCLITRVVPCAACLREPPEDLQDQHFQLVQAFRRLELGGEPPRRARGSQESRASDGDSGVGAESAASSRLGSVEGALRSEAEPQEAPEAPAAYGWTVEECILAACTAGELSCPAHGEVKLADLAPDTALLDVEEWRRARWDEVSLGGVAGRGAFGTVLRAAWRSQPAALKLLQPAPRAPPALARRDHHAYKAAVARWRREPAAAACRAYCALRQELSVLAALRHAHVLPLRAVCAAPLALLLALAPLGALEPALRAYRACGARVRARAARALALQAARALEYLHAKRIVYRDLKAENVLVWAMPTPQEAAAAEKNPEPIDVHVKLGDYGISRLAPPSGTKGFGGTEGFMAPEIMRYNGEEEYNEKVDCFSYGMLLYEILSLRQPFEGHEAVKEAVLDGARPTLTPRELQYPCCMLEAMRRAWSASPELRPSAAALVSLAAAPEFRALQDAASGPGAAASEGRAAVATPIARVTDEGGGGWEVWSAGEEDRVHTTLTTDTTFTHTHTLRLPSDNGEPVQMTAACSVGSSIWVGDSTGRVIVYSASRLSVRWSARVQESVGGPPAAVAALQPLPALRRVALALCTGRLFLVGSERPEPEGGFVLTELGTATELCCLAATATADGWEVWAGGAGLTAYALGAGGVRGAEALGAGRVALLAAAPAAGAVLVCEGGERGCVVEQWSTASRRPAARLDCSKLVPCSESLQSIAIDDHLSPGNCQVTALCCFGSQVYVGTAWGCIIVAEADTLRPITVFRPYEEHVRAILPLPGSSSDDGEEMLVTIGRGYRPLLQRYAPQQNNAANTSTGTYYLLWRAGHWLPD